MIQVAWHTRTEPLRLLVAPAPVRGRHHAVGDVAHRACVRSGDPLQLAFHVGTSVRPLVSCLLLGRVVVCYVEDVDDVAHVARRLRHAAPGHLERLSVGYWDAQQWHRTTLRALAV